MVREGPFCIWGLISRGKGTFSSKHARLGEAVVHLHRWRTSMSSFQFDRPSTQSSSAPSARAQRAPAPVADAPTPAHQLPCAQADGEP